MINLVLFLVNRITPPGGCNWFIWSLLIWGRFFSAGCGESILATRSLENAGSRRVYSGCCVSHNSVVHFNE
ncbi:MAG: hypothetical protein ACSLEN_02155 [Candidatus Malihini olakiniferum]